MHLTDVANDPVDDGHGKPATQIDDRRERLELSFAASELKFRRLFESAKDGILILDGESGTITDANPFLLDLLGYTHAEVIGKQIWEIGLLGDEEASRASFRELQEKGYVRYEHLPLKTRAGRSVDVEVVSNVYHAGDLIIIQCNIRDVTERKRAEKELRRAKEEAEEAGRTKDLFLSTLSHELRTPLTPVLATIAYIEMMPDLPERLRAEIASIRRNVELEAHLIDDLLDVTRIGQGKLELHLEILDAHLMVRSALELCQAEAEAKKLEVSLALRAEVHLVWADAARLQQVFWNLIKNAVKFTPAEGRISIRSADTGTGRLAIEVADTGAGIKPEFLPRVFNAFEQGNRESTRRYGGLGLGHNTETVSRSRDFAYTSQALDYEAKEVTNARDGCKGEGEREAVGGFGGTQSVAHGGEGDCAACVDLGAGFSGALERADCGGSRAEPAAGRRVAATLARRLGVAVRLGMH